MGLKCCLRCSFIVSHLAKSWCILYGALHVGSLWHHCAGICLQSDMTTCVFKVLCTPTTSPRLPVLPPILCFLTRMRAKGESTLRGRIKGQSSFLYCPGVICVSQGVCRRLSDPRSRTGPVCQDGCRDGHCDGFLQRSAHHTLWGMSENM